ncbi:imm11 family protein [Pedobacter cryophilus]|uniref:Immunity MXAN-0049 protein domain-containing protein n=1 Tax=Pedobacter cryophilus TaxID=2571271 RepID=A0A4U1C5X3_9SPHI|nr:DUF1629 domain-containing protein [Pedobacter cryophilus]TKC00799.1 hypothetical protein FA046_03745 [Pedobacter cryophilus]
MSFYKLEYSSDEEVIGKTAPQSQEFVSLIPVDHPNHLWSVWGELPDDIYIPDSILHRKAKVTDLISSSPIYYPIISDKLKNILAKHRSTGLKFLPTHLIVKDKKIDYWLMNAYKFDYQYIDFKKSIINKVGIGRVKIETLKINSASELETAIKKIVSPNTGVSVWIDKLVLQDNIPDEMIFIDRFKGSNYYVSESLKEEIENANCTGIDFVPHLQ